MMSALIILMTEAVSYSETSVSIYQTKRCNIPEDCHLQFQGKPLSRLKRRWEYNINMDLIEIGIGIGCMAADWFPLVQDRVQWRGFLN
jgi:hypothetical protein